jgi:hypothetical protein
MAGSRGTQNSSGAVKLTDDGLQRNVFDLDRGWQLLIGGSSDVVAARPYVRHGTFHKIAEGVRTEARPAFLK